MTICYQPNTRSMQAKYVCSCGHKFTRKNSDWWTRSPFNSHTDEYCDAKVLIYNLTKKRICPKCKAEVCPVLSCFQKADLNRYLAIIKAPKDESAEDAR